ncbi:hypothetical protein T08_2669 [Trichinella sp. T8]|nr:hypothetical protein T08_2669 [Trichinella sp. T8]
MTSMKFAIELLLILECHAFAYASLVATVVGVITNVLSTEKLNVETEFIVYTLLLRCYPMHSAYTEKRSLKMAHPHLKTSVLKLMLNMPLRLKIAVRLRMRASQFSASISRAWCVFIIVFIKMDISGTEKYERMWEKHTEFSLGSVELIPCY